MKKWGRRSVRLQQYYKQGKVRATDSAAGIRELRKERRSEGPIARILTRSVQAYVMGAKEGSMRVQIRAGSQTSSETGGM